jgi:signal transduction histidine kinase/CheY-like chemotaxis protein
VIELALYLLLVLFTALAARLLQSVGPVAHWILAWGVAGLGGFLPYVAQAWPRLAVLSQALGTLFAALLVSGTLLFAARAVPAWFLPSALAFGLLRAALATQLGDAWGYGLGLAVEPFGIAYGAIVAGEAARRPGASVAERLLGPAFALLALASAIHLAWLFASGSATPLLPFWVLVAPVAVGVQIQAGADRLRRQTRDALEARVTERTIALAEAQRERERLARHVEQVERLESLGILAGGIAHDFNNLLTVIRGSAKLALRELSHGAPARDRVVRIAAAAEHAAALTDEMLAYAGKAPTALAPLALPALVAEMRDLLRGSVSASALDFAVDAAVPPVEADANGPRRVLLNLVLNASEALGEKPGRVTVRVAQRTVEETTLAASFGTPGLPAGPYVALEVADEGPGMDDETARRLFEPFFSTKFSGRGLGMAAVLGIVQAHGGAIDVDTAVGRGTRVGVLLPPSTRAARRVEVAPAAPAPAPFRPLCVLVVDDDAGVLELAREVLAAAGHRVETADGGRAALERLRGDPTRADVLVLDLTMPDVGGDVVLREARALRADLPVILVTGYDAAHAAERASGSDAFLRKPWEPEDLVAAVERRRSGRG